MPSFSLHAVWKFLFLFVFFVLFCVFSSFSFNQVELPVKDLLCSELLNQGIIVGKTGSAKGMPVFIPLR